MTFRTMTLGVLLLAAFSLSAFGQKEKPKDKDKETPKAKVYKTPQQVFDAFVTAFEKDDTKTWVACMAPEAQKEVVAGMATQFISNRASLKALDEEEAKPILEKLKPIHDVLDKHGLTEKATKDVSPKDPEKAKKTINGLVKNPEAMLIDLFTALEKLGGKPNSKFNDKPKLTGVKIDGDKAAGTVVSTEKGEKKEEAVTFVKVKGSWRVIPPMGGGKTKGKGEKAEK